MRKVSLIRTETSDEGTFGHVLTDSGFECYTGELPWRDNSGGKSCIPKGIYQCQRKISPKHGPCYYVLNVLNRTDVEIHSGNFCGDTDLKLKSDVLGCILLGNSIGEIAGQKALVSSRDAIARFEADLEGNPFELSVV